MDGSDAFGSSTAPLTWHDFLERMRHPSAADFVKSIKSFIVSFSNNVSDPEKDSAAVQDFLTNMEVAFRAHSLWAGCSEEELESAGEGLEKYVMTKLFTRAFASLPEDVKRDDELSEKMALIQQFIRPENLDIKPTFQNETSWLLAQKELQKINKYKAPRDKLACILSCCKAINNSLLSASIASNENPPGADEFLPVLIYVTIKANPPQLHSNLLYIQRYRRQSRLVSEAAYFFTNILSAESFISSIDAQSLSMDETEFENNMESARALLLGLSTDLESFSNERNQDAEHLSTMEAKKDRNSSPLGMGNPLPPQASSKKAESKDPDEKDRLVTRPSISDLEKEGAADLLKEDQVSRSFREYPFLYAHVGDLTINDVEDLLNSYKQLVLKYVSLSKGMAMSNPPIPFTQIESRKEFDDSTVVGTNDEQYKETRMTEEVFDGNSLIDINSESKLHPDESVTYPSGEDGDIH